MTIPTNVDIERLVLGYTLKGAANMDVIRPSLELQDFSLEAHRRIWRAACDLYDAGTGADIITVHAALMSRGEAESVGGLSYLVDLNTGLPDKPQLGGYIEILKDKALRRRIIAAADLLGKQAQDQAWPAEELLDSISALGAKLTDGAQDAHKRLISTADLIAQQGVEKLLGKRKHAGIRLPWSKLDRDLSGFDAGQMIVLMAETSRGKTSAALQVAACAALQGQSPIIWTMEMSPESMFRRLVNQISGVSGYSTQLTLDDREAQRDAIARLNDQPIYFDRHSRTIPSFCASIRQVRTHSSVGIAIVDYLQLIRSQGVNRAQEVSNNSRALKLAAMDLGIPILVLSQVDRASVKGGGEIGLHSGKESGDIENDADVLLWIKAKELSRDQDTMCQMWVGKQREGAAGFGVPMVFRPGSQTFLEVSDK